jgi:uncharacterized protein YbjT (DUF2867 family)
MILVTGATGPVGREAVQLLLAAGAHVGAVTRYPARAGLPAGTDVIGGDPSRPHTLTSRLDGVTAVLITPRAVGDATAELLSLAAGHGAERAVVLSAATVQYPAGLPRFAADFKAVEDAARASGLAVTALRCADFDANALAWAPQIRQGGVVYGAYACAATSPIHHRDVAAVAVQALTGAGHQGDSHVLTGPQSLTQPDKVRLIGQATGLQLSFAEVAPEQVRQAMLAQGLPEEIPDRLLGSLADYARRPGPATDTVQQLLGRPALNFAQWAAENAAAFRPATRVLAVALPDPLAGGLGGLARREGRRPRKSVCWGAGPTTIAAANPRLPTLVMDVHQGGYPSRRPARARRRAGQDRRLAALPARAEIVPTPSSLAVNCSSQTAATPVSRWWRPRSRCPVSAPTS